MAYAGLTFTKKLTEDEEQAVLAFALTEEGIDREFLQAVDGIINHCMVTYKADTAKVTQAEAVSMKEKYAKLEKADQDRVDAILATAAVSVDPNAEPMEP